MTSKKTQYVTIGAMIAALYVILTMLSSMFGLSSGVIQVRLSEALNIFACFTSAAIPGMFVGCIAANLLTGGVPLDLIFGSLATLIGVSVGRGIAKVGKGKFNVLVPIPTILANAVIVPLVLQKGYGIDLTYHYLFITVGLGEVISAGFIGWLLYFTLMKIPQFRKMNSNDKYNSKKSSAQRVKERTKSTVEADEQEIKKEN